MKKAKKIKSSVIAACLVLGGGLFYVNHKNIVHANAEDLPEGICEEFSSDFVEDTAVDLTEYEQYKPFGLEYNSKNERFYFKDQLVRYFKDQVNSSGIIIGFSYDDGEVDIIAKRDSAYKLKELDIQEQAAFEEGYPAADDSLAAYESFGVQYEKSQDLWRYNGQIIRAFHDEGHNTYLSAENAALDSDLSLIVTRDKGGKITSIDKMTEEQFNRIFN